MIRQFVSLGVVALLLALLRVLIVGPTRPPFLVVSFRSLPAGTLLLDARDVQDFAAGQVPGALSLPCNQGVPALPAFLLDRRRHPSVACYDWPGTRGGAQMLAAALHRQRGDTIWVVVDPPLPGRMGFPRGDGLPRAGAPGVFLR